MKFSTSVLFIWIEWYTQQFQILRKNAHKNRQPQISPQETFKMHIGKRCQNETKGLT